MLWKKIKRLMASVSVITVVQRLLSPLEDMYLKTEKRSIKVD